MACAGLAACSGPGGDVETDELAPAATARPGVRADIEAVHALNASVGAYEERLTAECMRAKGFQYQVPQAAPVPTFDKVYGFTRDEVAGGFPRLDDPPADPNATYATRLSGAQKERYYSALFGAEKDRVTHTLSDGSGEIAAPGSGCIAEAETTMFGAPGAGTGATDLAGNLPNRALLAAQDDPAMVDLDRAWSECMSSAGHEGLDEPGAALAAAREAGVTTAPSRRLAKDSVTCEEKGGYADARRALEDRYLTGMMDARSAEVTGARESLEQAIDRAETALG